MRGVIAQLCALSVFCGLALSLTPEGSVKRATALCCSVLLTLCLLTAAKDFDYGSYALELSRYRELGETLRGDAEARTQRLNRLAVAQECEAYIQKQAAALGAPELRAAVGLRWSTEGFWVPDSAVLTGRIAEDARERLSALIAAELGIGEEEQEWLTDEA